MIIVSVITPVFEGGDLLRVTVESVNNQIVESDVFIEHVLVSDDGHDYAHYESSQTGYRCRVLTTGQRGAGPSVARNIGLQAATGSYVSFLDADDFWLPHRLSTLLPFAAKHGAACDSTCFVDMDGHRLYGDSTVIKASGLLGKKEALGIDNAFFPLYQRTLLSHSWDEDLCFSEDFLFNFMAISQVEGLYVSPDPLMAYRIRPGSISHVMPEFSINVDAAYGYFLGHRNPINTLPDSDQRLFRDRVAIKRELNRQYTAAWRENPDLTFEDFIGQRKQPSPNELTVLDFIDRMLM